MSPYALSAAEAILTGVAVGLGSVATTAAPRDWESAMIAGVIAATGVMLSSLRSLKASAPGSVQVPTSAVTINERRDPNA